MSNILVKCYICNGEGKVMGITRKGIELIDCQGCNSTGKKWIPQSLVIGGKK